LWWVNASNLWNYETLLDSFLRSCWDPPPSFVYDLRRSPTSSLERSSIDFQDVA
jgi:hypothetical protein